MSLSTSAQEDRKLLNIFGWLMFAMFAAVGLVVGLVTVAEWWPAQALFVTTVVVLVPLYAFLTYARVRAVRRGGSRLVDCTSTLMMKVFLFCVGVFGINTAIQALSAPPPGEPYNSDALNPLQSILGGSWLIACTC